MGNVRKYTLPLPPPPFCVAIWHPLIFCQLIPRNCLVKEACFVLKLFSIMKISNKNFNIRCYWVNDVQLFDKQTKINKREIFWPMQQIQCIIPFWYLIVLTFKVYHFAKQSSWWMGEVNVKTKQIFIYVLIFIVKFL